jgi:hypothetical protein
MFINHAFRFLVLGSALTVLGQGLASWITPSTLLTQHQLAEVTGAQVDCDCNWYILGCEESVHCALKDGAGKDACEKTNPVLCCSGDGLIDECAPSGLKQYLFLGLIAEIDCGKKKELISCIWKPATEKCKCIGIPDQKDCVASFEYDLGIACKSPIN